jgi:hypothetical protein
MKQKWGFNMTDLGENELRILSEFDKSFDSFMTDDRKLELEKNLCLHFYLVGRGDGLNYPIMMETEKVDRQDDSI